MFSHVGKTALKRIIYSSCALVNYLNFQKHKTMKRCGAEAETKEGGEAPLRLSGSTQLEARTPPIIELSYIKIIGKIFP